jgi:hypothetical protein
MIKYIILTALVFSRFVCLSQWSMTLFRDYESPPTSFQSSIDNDLYLEIYHNRVTNKALLDLNINMRRELYGIPGSIKMLMINDGDTSVFESEELVVTVDYNFTLDLNQWEHSNKFFKSKEVIIIIFTSEEIVKANFKMEGITEIQERLTNYVEFSNYSWKWNEFECIYEFGATVYNYSRKNLEKLNVLLIVSNVRRVYYKKQHELVLNCDIGEIGSVKITLQEPLCSINDVLNFEKNHRVLIKTIDKTSSSLIIDWK